MRTLALLIAVIGLGQPVTARAVTCTASDIRILVRNFDIEAPLPTLTDFVLPVEIAATAGSFRLDLSTIPATDFAPFGVASVLHLGGAYFGTIDGAGNVDVPGIAVGFTVTAVGADVNTTASLSTGIAAIALGSPAVDYITEGSPLDFGTRTLRLVGQGLIPNAPLANGPVLSGLSITCQLDQVPLPETLPVAPTLSGVVGKGRFGKAKPAGEVAGDTLVVKARLRPGTIAPDPSAADVFVRIAAPGAADVVLSHAPVGVLAAKGKKTLQAIDTDGTTLRLVVGQKRIGGAGAAKSGRLVITTGKKGLGIQFTQAGLDLCQLPANAAVTVAIGTVTATAPITVKTRGKGACS